MILSLTARNFIHYIIYFTTGVAVTNVSWHSDFPGLVSFYNTELKYTRWNVTINHPVTLDINSVSSSSSSLSPSSLPDATFTAKEMLRFRVANETIPLTLPSHGASSLVLPLGDGPRLTAVPFP